MINPSEENRSAQDLDLEGLRDEYLKDSVQEIPVQSYKILHQCFHPCYEPEDFANSLDKDNKLPQSNYILIFEQQMCGRTLKSKTNEISEDDTPEDSPMSTLNDILPFTQQDVITNVAETFDLVSR